MALAPLRLDDVTWEQLVLAARNNIAAASRGEWTHHSPVDPGVTLVELYAWLFEQRIFWLDQVGDPLRRSLSKLLGGAVAGPRCARTVVVAASRQGVAAAAQPIAEGTTLHHGDELVFTTLESVRFVPHHGVGLHVAGRDRSAELEQGRAIALAPGAEAPDGESIPSCPGCPPPAPPSAQRSIAIALYVSDPGSGELPLGLLFELDVPAAIEPGWAPNGAEVAPAAEIELWYRSAAGLARLPAGYADGTHGLRRSGILRFVPPADWEREPAGSAISREGVLPYVLTLRIGAGAFTSPPRLRRLELNAVVAEHRHEASVAPQKVDWLPLPGREAQLGLSDRVLPETVALELLERGQWTSWTSTPDLSFHGPDERRFEVDRAAGSVRFGDGLMGRVPRVDAAEANLRGSAQLGGGARGNLAAHNSWRAGAHPELRFENVVDGRWGANEQTTEQALRQRAAELARRERAITAEEHCEVAMATPGVAIARAHAAVGHHPRHPCLYVPSAVTVFVVPQAPRDAGSVEADSAYVAAPEIDRGALAAARAHVDRWRLLGSEVFVENAIYRDLELSVALLGDPRDLAELSRRLRRRLRAFLDPLEGGADGRGWPFGAALRPSALARVAQREAGNAAEVETIAIALDGGEPEACAETLIAPHELVVCRRVTVTLRRAARRGGLQ